MDARHQVRRVLIITLVLNLAVAVGKIIVGALTGAVSITADGFHSLMDGSSNLIGLGANAEGIAGSCANVHLPRLTYSSSGMPISSRWPTAEETIVSSPSK